MLSEQVAGRLQNIVSGAAMVYRLILSGVASSALDPLNVKDWPPQAKVQRSLANLYNLLATVQICHQRRGQSRHDLRSSVNERAA